VAGLPLVGVEIDVDDDESADFLVVPEPLGADPPHADVLAATTYDVRSCNGFNLEACTQIERKRYLNGLPADVAPTHPFFNGALVLPVYAVDLGLEEDASTLKYRGVSRSITGTAEQTDWASFDAVAPAVDTTAGGIREGQPFFEGAVVVRGSGSLLVIHHANVTGQHWEVVEIDELGGVPLALSLAGPETVALEERLVATVALDNGGEADLEGVTVEVSVEGGILELVTTAMGTCDGAICSFASLPGGATATIDLKLVATGPVEIEATVTTAAGCNDTQSLAVALAAAVPPPVPPLLVPSGGCGCRLGPADDAGWLSLLLALGLLRRRRAR
jgi:MYXO-CTERM domain-containing protein